MAGRLSPARQNLQLHRKSDGGGMTWNGYDIHPIKAWSASGFFVGTAMLLPTLKIVETTAYLLRKNGSGYDLLPSVQFADALIFTLPVTTPNMATYDKYAIGYRVGEAADNWDDVAGLYNASVSGTTTKTIPGQFSLTRFVAENPTYANGELLDIVAGHTYDLAFFGNSTTEIYYLFEGGVLIQSLQVYTGEARTSLALSGSPTILRAKYALTGSYRAVHDPFSASALPALPFPETFSSPQQFSRDGVTLWAGVGGILKSSTDLGQTFSAVGDFREAAYTSDATAFISYLKEDSQGHIFVGVKFPEGSPSAQQCTRASHLWRSTAPMPCTTFTKVLELPWYKTWDRYDEEIGDIYAGYSSFMVTAQNCMTETLGGRLWLCTYGLERPNYIDWGVTPVDFSVCMPNMYWSDDGGLTWGSLGNPNEVDPLPFVTTIRHIENVYADKTIGALHFNVGDPNVGSGTTIAATLPDADIANPAWSMLVPAQASAEDVTAGIFNNGYFQGRELADGSIIHGADRHPGGGLREYYAAGEWHFEFAALFAGRYDNYTQPMVSESGVLTVVFPADPYSWVGHENAFFIFQGKSADKLFLTYEKGENTNTKGSVIGDSTGSRYAAEGLTTGTGRLVDLEPFVSTTIIEAPVSPFKFMSGLPAGTLKKLDGSPAGTIKQS